MIWGIYSGTKVIQLKNNKKKWNLKFNHKNNKIGFPIGSDILDSSTHENEVYSDNSQRITVDTDWADGLTSRFLYRKFNIFYSLNTKICCFTD